MTMVDEAEVAEVGTHSRRRNQVVIAAIVLVLLVAGFTYGATRDFFHQQLIAIACLYAVVALSLDLVWGYTGILSMGHAVFFGLGAYAVGLSQVRVNDLGSVEFRVTHWWSFPMGILAGIVVVTLLAIVIGWLAFYGRGATPFYVAVVTLALTVVLSAALVQIDFVGGQSGLSGFPILGISGFQWYLICTGVLALAWLACVVVVRSDFGLLLRAIRDNEHRCRYLGYNVALTKTLVFAGSAGLAALAGALYAGYVGFVSPPFVGFLIATNFIIWVAVGGRGTLVGPIVGALAINLGGSDLSARFPYEWTLVLGIAFVLIVVFVPEGVLPGAARLVRKATHRPLDAVGQFDHPRRLVARDRDEDAGVAGTEWGAELKVDEVQMSFGALQVLRGISLDVRRGELICIVGPNGAGKTTLLSVITDGTVAHTGQVSISSAHGTVSLRDKNPGDIVRAGVGRKFQNPNLFETLTPLETVLLASRRGRTPSLWRRTRAVEVNREAAEIFRLTGLEPFANAVTDDLSHGLKQALEVVMTVSLQPRVLLLDEPTAGLTAEERSLIGSLLRDLAAGGTTIILIEHDFGFVRQIADRIAVLHDGRVLELGTVAEVADSELVKRVYLGSSL
jgi:branched-chain amino acid transport system permease protein